MYSFNKYLLGSNYMSRNKIGLKGDTLMNEEKVSYLQRASMINSGNR